MQDPSANAMTEVALGLSMAFFALLILALISMGLGSTAVTSSATAAISEQIRVDVTHNQNNKSEVPKDSILVFYVDGKWLYPNRGEVSLDDIDEQSTVVLAVPPSMSVAQLTDLQSSIRLPHAQFTLMDRDWLQFFSGDLK